MKERVLKGLSVSKGIARGPLFFIEPNNEDVPNFEIEETSVDREIARFRDALVSSKDDLKSLQESLTDEDAPEVAQILDSHLEMLKDPLMTQETEVGIRKMCRNAESVFLDVITDYKSQLKDVKDNFFEERVRDITDVSKRVLSHLKPFKKADLSSVPPQSILASNELVPSNIAEVKSDEISAFITKFGGISSHAAIIARAKGIPYVAGIDTLELLKEEVREIIVDGTKGRVILNPTDKTKEKYAKVAEKQSEHLKQLESEMHLDAETVDGYSVSIHANLENADDIEYLISQGASGVGLFRSEYLFLSKNRFPTEEEQFQTYKTILEKLPDAPVVIRVFDVGGDKQIESTKNNQELNPVLGCRAIRFLLRHQELFENQLRALLRASIYGNLHILIPMVSDLSEIRMVKKLIQKIQDELKNEQIPVKEKISLGCMIEVPSSAIMSDLIVKEVDFLSIGTNDLVQYSLAADRTNPHLDYLSSPAHPSILRLIRMIVSAANSHQKRLILCGEMASNPKFIPLLLGFGIREFSVSARFIPMIKHTVRKLSIVESNQFAEKAFDFSCTEELTRFIQESFN